MIKRTSCYASYDGDDALFDTSYMDIESSMIYVKMTLIHLMISLMKMITMCLMLFMTSVMVVLLTVYIFNISICSCTSSKGQLLLSSKSSQTCLLKYVYK